MNKCDKKTTDNERFGASGTVSRPKDSADFEVLCLVSSAVEAPPAAKPATTKQESLSMKNGY